MSAGLHYPCCDVMGLWGTVTTVTCLAHRPFIVSEMAKIRILGDRYYYVLILMTWRVLVTSGTAWDSDVLL